MKGKIAILKEYFDWKATYHIFNRRKRFDNKRFKKCWLQIFDIAVTVDINK